MSEQPIPADFIAEHNSGFESAHKRDYEALGEQLARRGFEIEKITEKVADYFVALPSWGTGTGGTRFGRFPGRGEPRGVFDKLDDCAVVNQLSSATPRVSLHIPWDKADPKKLKEHAAALGLSFDAMNSNTFADAAGQIGPENVVVQQLIPGGGECQFSYAALWNEGAPVAEFTARRTRQYPVEFGFTSTFVEVVDEPEATGMARRLLRSIGHHGLVEIEFKRNPRDGSLLLLDVNPRPWSWFGLAAAAGVDLGAMMWEVAHGRPVPDVAARQGTAWMYLARDLAAATGVGAEGLRATGGYARSFASVKAWATFAGDDPLPGLIDIPLTAWRVLTRRILR